jgi:hypothetical protein
MPIELVRESNGQWGTSFELPAHLKNHVVLKLPESGLDIQSDEAVYIKTIESGNQTEAVAMFEDKDFKAAIEIAEPLAAGGDARAMAMAAEKDGVCIYSFTRTYGEMMPAAEFIRHIERSIRMIEAKTGDLSRRGDREVIEPEGDLSSILMTLNF